MFLMNMYIAVYSVPHIFLFIHAEGTNVNSRGLEKNLNFPTSRALLGPPQVCRAVWRGKTGKARRLF